MNGMLLIHLPDGPTAHFKLSNLVLSRDIKVEDPHPSYSIPSYPASIDFGRKWAFVTFAQSSGSHRCILDTMTSVISCQMQGHGRAGEFKAELILKNFHTLMGRRVGRMFASLFAQDPHFKGRQVATLHNQRDYIFFRYRHHLAFSSVQNRHLRINVKQMSHSCFHVRAWHGYERQQLRDTMTDACGQCTLCSTTSNP